jgi:hypothetical protein
MRLPILSLALALAACGAPAGGPSGPSGGEDPDGDEALRIDAGRPGKRLVRDGTSHPGWEGGLSQLRAHPVRGSDFEVIEAGPLTAC